MKRVSAARATRNTWSRSQSTYREMIFMAAGV
jgi:hypothetical protein